MSQKLNIEILQDYAKKKDGECLSTEYINIFTKLQWQCHKKHIWWATPNNIKNHNRWCPHCYKEIRDDQSLKYNLKFFQDYAKKKDGECLSTKYRQVTDPLIFRCSEDHTWEVTAANVIYHHSWCPECAGCKRKTITNMHSLAERKRGKFLSPEYNGNKYKYDWQCANGHKFSARASNVKTGFWCPYCNSRRGEQICRAYFEQLFGYPFIKVKPEWLINKNNNCLELDGYCDEMKIAFEHQGWQHYKTIKFFKIDQARLDDIQHNDLYKLNECKKRGITLIQIPSITENGLSDEQIKAIIKKGLIENNLAIPQNFDKKIINLNNIQHTSILEKIRKKAEENKGQLISTVYLGASHKLEFKCVNNHVFKALPYNVLQHDHWCASCAGNKKKTLAQMHELAARKRGLCLSPEYINSLTPLTWQCEAGHIFTKKYCFAEKYWCLECKKKLVVKEKDCLLFQLSLF